MPVMSDFIAELEPSFYRECKYKDLAELSIRNYRRTFKVYRDWLSNNGYPIDYTCLEAERYLEWSEWLRENRAPSTANLYLILVRSFVTWAHGEGEVDNVLPRITIPPAARKPQVIEDDLLTKLLKATKQEKRQLAIRAELIVRLLLDTGIRRSELVGIKTTDIDMEDLSIKVLGKGNKSRLVYFGNNTARALDRWLRVRKQFPGHATPWLLLGQQGRLKANGVRQLIYKLCDVAGIKRINLHAFRHTFCHDFLESGGSERDLMRLAGWTTDTMLDIYGAERAQQRASGSHKRLSRGDRV